MSRTTLRQPHAPETTSSTRPAARSALALELGRTHARAVLVERVDGQPRFVASGEALTTALGPTNDAVTGARAAIAQIEAAIGRTLFAQGAVLQRRAADGAGVDAVALVVDAAPSVRVATCGDRPSLAAARRLFASLDVPDEPAIELRAQTDSVELARQLQRPARPSDPRVAVDAVLLLGPADAPALGRLADALAILAPSGASAAPIVVWAGEPAGADIARSALGGRCELRVVAPLVPRPDFEHLAPARGALLHVWRERLDVALPGAEAVARWAGQVLPRRRAEEVALGYFAAQRGRAVWLARNSADAATLLHVSSLDLHRVQGAASAAPPEPFARQIRPWMLPATPEAAADLRGLLVARLRAAAAALDPRARPSAGRGPGLLIGAGDLALLGAEDAVRALVDALDPSGAVQVVVDEVGGLACVGALAECAPELAAGVLAEDLLRPLGALIAPDWRARVGRPVFRFRSGSAGARGADTVEITAEETRRVRLGEGESARVQVERPAWWDVRRFFGGRVSAEIEGGPVGLILDGRARPTAGPLSLGRETIVDDAAAPRFTADVIAARAIVDTPSLIRRTRPLPIDARLLVGPGDTVEANELIAQLYDHADGAAHEVVPAGRLLGVDDPRPYLVVPAGARVAAGDVLARRESFFGFVKKTVRAPIDGILSPELGGFGNVLIVAGGARLGIAAHLPGTVVGLLPEHGAVIQTTGALVAAAVGFGPEARGPLLAPVARLDAAVDGRAGTRNRGAVAVLDVLDRGQLELLRAAGVAGAIVGSIVPELATELDADPSELAIVAVEGIGTAPLCARACALLAAHTGNLACLTPGDRRDPASPAEVIVPLSAAPTARPAADPRLAEGASVRVGDRGPAIGRVATLAAAPTRLPTGLWTRTAEVELESGERVVAPLANLELVG